MPIKALYRKLPLIFLIGSIPGLEACQNIQIKNRTPCFINGEISLGSTCSDTVGTPTTTQLTVQETLDMLEARPAIGDQPAHPPAVFQSADDYGEETTELETACRILGKNCTYELKNTITIRKAVLDQLHALK